ncbi:MAG: 1-acyl-sn-glycerol-3-phosphate acyltransferase [Alphaproteobacteria bacterium]|nr:1-acyl-sn-glycerol-3-phosphate acyltransferase [Alphaproteobacteria bacterium SS10]
MLTYLRILLHGIVYIGWTAFCCLAYLPLLLLPGKKLRGWLTEAYFKVHDYIEPPFGLTYTVEGRENLPDGPCLVALQHQSGWETMRLIHLFRDPAIIMKIELFRMPLWGWYASRADMIPIDRSLGKDAIPTMLADSEKKIADGRDIVIFPQGTRVPPGVKRDYRTGIAKLYEHLQVPVVPVALNSGLFATKMGLVKRSGSVSVKILPPIEPGKSQDELMSILTDVIETEGDKLLAAEGFIPTAPAAPAPEKASA